MSGLADSHLRQGITTEIVVADKDAFDSLDARGTVTNVGALVPLLSSPSIDAAMRDGAFGVATTAPPIRRRSTPLPPSSAGTTAP